MHQKRLAAGLCPDPLESLHSAPPDLLAVFKSEDRDKGWRKREKSGGGRQLREGDKGRREEAGGEKGRKRVGGEWKQKSRSGVQMHSRQRKIRHMQKSVGTKIRKLRGQSLNLVS